MQIQGILMDIAGYTTPKSMSKLNVEISSTGKKGVYSIALIDGKENFKNVTLDFQVRGFVEMKKAQTRD